MSITQLLQIFLFRISILNKVENYIQYIKTAQKLMINFNCRKHILVPLRYIFKQFDLTF